MALIPTRLNGQRIQASWFNILKDLFELFFGGAIAQTNATLDNNATVVIPVLSFDSAERLSATVEYYISRVSDTDAKVIERGDFKVIYDGTDWDLIDGSKSGDDSSVTFSITQGNPIGQVSYTSSNFDNTGYVGRIDVTAITFSV